MCIFVLIKNTAMEIIKSIKEIKNDFFENYNPDEEINISATAKSYGVSRLTIYNWIKEMSHE